MTNYYGTKLGDSFELPLSVNGIAYKYIVTVYSYYVYITIVEVSTNKIICENYVDHCDLDESFKHILCKNKIVGYFHATHEYEHVILLGLGETTVFQTDERFIEAANYLPKEYNSNLFFISLNRSGYVLSYGYAMVDSDCKSGTLKYVFDNGQNTDLMFSYTDFVDYLGTEETRFFQVHYSNNNLLGDFRFAYENKFYSDPDDIPKDIPKNIEQSVAYEAVPGLCYVSEAGGSSRTPEIPSISLNIERFSNKDKKTIIDNTNDYNMFYNRVVKSENCVGIIDYISDNSSLDLSIEIDLNSNYNENTRKRTVFKKYTIMNTLYDYSDICRFLDDTDNLEEKILHDINDHIEKDIPNILNDLKNVFVNVNIYSNTNVKCYFSPILTNRLFSNVNDIKIDTENIVYIFDTVDLRLGSLVSENNLRLSIISNNVLSTNHLSVTNGDLYMVAYPTVSEKGPNIVFSINESLSFNGSTVNILPYVKCTFTTTNTSLDTTVFFNLSGNGRKKKIDKSKITFNNFNSVSVGCQIDRYVDSGRVLSFNHVNNVSIIGYKRDGYNKSDGPDISIETFRSISIEEVDYSFPADMNIKESNFTSGTLLSVNKPVTGASIHMKRTNIRSEADINFTLLRITGGTDLKLNMYKTYVYNNSIRPMKSSNSTKFRSIIVDNSNIPISGLLETTAVNFKATDIVSNIGDEGITCDKIKSIIISNSTLKTKSGISLDNNDLENIVVSNSIIEADSITIRMSEIDSVVRITDSTLKIPSVDITAIYTDIYRSIFALKTISVTGFNLFFNSSIRSPSSSRISEKFNTVSVTYEPTYISYNEKKPVINLTTRFSKNKQFDKVCKVVYNPHKDDKELISDINIGDRISSILDLNSVKNGGSISFDTKNDRKHNISGKINLFKISFPKNSTTKNYDGEIVVEPPTPFRYGG